MAWFKGSADNVSLEPLRLRVGVGLAGQQSAQTHLNSLLIHSSLARRKLWLAPENVQTAALGWWLMQIHWQIAHVFVEAIGLEAQEDQVPRAAYEVGEQLCAAAEAMSVIAIRSHNQVEVSASLQPMPLQPFPDLPIDESVVTGVWAAYEAIYYQVQTDRQRILAAQVPRRFQPVLEALQRDIQPSLALHEHFQYQWPVASSPQHQLQIVRQAQGEAQQLFAAGQKLWAPYLLDGVYTQCVHARQTIDDLELGFDPWALTDPAVKGLHRGSQKSVEALTAFWFDNPHPEKSYRLQGEILAAHDQRLVRYVNGQAFPYCPWAPMWLAWKPVTIGGTALRPGAYFVLYAGRNADGDFVSEIRSLGRFQLEIGKSVKSVDI